jgi:hypothetical protein
MTVMNDAAFMRQWGVHEGNCCAPVRIADFADFADCIYLLLSFGVVSKVEIRL